MPRATAVRATATNPPSPSPYLPDTWGGIHAFQVFDNQGQYSIPPAQAAQDGPRYDFVWGVSTPQMVAAWRTNNPKLVASYYFPFDADTRTDKYGDLGHDLAWWLANHPDWVLYECDKTTVAYVGGLKDDVPFDISNPAVVAYQASVLGPYAQANGYSGLGADVIALENNTGGEHGGTQGCGIWTTDSHGQPLWVQKFSGAQVDPAWAAAAVQWTVTMQQDLHALSPPLSLLGNLDVASHAKSDQIEQTLIGALDVVFDEAAYTRYGLGYDSDREFNRTVYWAQYAQAHGKGFVVVDVWPPKTTVTNAQLDYAIATYLMSKEQASDLFTAPFRTYGEEHWYPQYTASVGKPCAEMYGGPSYEGSGQYVYYRKYTGALAIVNTSATVSYTVALPKPKYTSIIDGSTVKSPLTIGPDSGAVLMTSAGCSP